MDRFLNEYKKKIGEPIALFCVMGNKRFLEDFQGEPELVYAYCLEHNKTWEEVLNFKYDESKDY